MDRDESIDVITTINGGAKPSQTVAESGALLGYESGNDRPPQDLPVDFVDWPFTKEGVTFDDHLETVRRESPKYAVAPDVEDADELEEAIEQADRLAEHADVVIMVPKAVHPTEIPDRFRVGLPLANFGDATEDVEEFVDTSGTPQFHQWTDYRDVGSVHILGGSPTIQREVVKYGVPVESLDGASVFKGAQMGNIWAPSRERNWHPAHPDRFDFYDRLRASLDNIVEAWGAGVDFTIPEDRADVKAAREASSAERERIETEREYHRHGAHGAPPAIDPADRDLWGPGELEEMDPAFRDFSEEIEALEEQALEAIKEDRREGTRGTNLEAFATDDGDVATDFEPGCRHCEMTALNRFDAALADVEEAQRSMSNDDSNPYDPTEEFGAGGQRTLGGGPEGGQARIADVDDGGESEIESSEEKNPGGLEADERDLEDDPDDADQASLDVGAGARRDPDESGLDDFATDGGGVYDPTDEDDDGDDWRDSFKVESAGVPEYVGEWERDDSEALLTYEADGYRARVAETGDGGGHMALFENLYSDAADPSEKIQSYHLDDSEEKAKRTLINWIKNNEPEDALEKLPNYASDRDPTMAEFTPEERGRIKHHAETGDMAALLRTIGADTRMGMGQNFADAGIMSIEDFLDHDDFTDVDGVGPTTAEKIEAALPQIEGGVIRARGDDEGDQEDDDGVDDDGPGIDGYDDAQEELREKNPELTIYVHEKDDHIILEKIIVPEDQRGQGKGTAFMEDLVEYADRTGKSVSLTPSEDYGASSRDRLIDFYSRFGFVKNEGEHKDYQISEGMYRLPEDVDDQDDVDDELDVTLLPGEPEDDVQDVTIPREVNGWEYDADAAPTRAAIVWTAPTGSDDWVGYDQTGGHSWSAWLDGPDRNRRDTYESFGSPEDAIDHAVRLMERHDPAENWGPTADEPVPEAEREREFETHSGEVLDHRELPDSGLSASDLTDWPYINRESGPSEDERDHFEDIMSGIYDPTEEDSTTTGGGDVFDPTELFEDDVAEEFDAEVEWQDVEHPENVPEGEKETEIDLAERILRAGGNRTGFGHHEEIRRSMGEWREEYAGTEDDPGYWERMTFELTPGERNMGRLEGDLEERYKKARTVIAWASDNIDHDVLRELEREQSKEATEAWKEQAEDVASEKAARELFVDDPPEQYEGWERIDISNPDEIVTYYGVENGHEKAVIAYETGEDEGDVKEVLLEEIDEGVPVDEIPANRYPPYSGTWHEDLKEHLDTFGKHLDDDWLEGPDDVETADDVDEELEDAETYDPTEDVDESPIGDPIEVEFGKRQYANEFRDDNPDLLHGNDNRSMKTVRLKPSIDDEDVEKAEDEAFMSRSDETKTYGQSKLTDAEREQLQERDDWTWGSNGFEAESAKAALLAEGATDWMNYYEAGMDQSSALELFEQGKKAAAEGRGPTAAGDVVDSDPDPGEVARQAEKVQGEQCSAAEQAARVEADLEALEFLLEHCDWTEDDVAELEDSFAEIGEQPEVVLGAVYDPTQDTGEDMGASFEEWAAEAAPEPPDRPSEEELAEIAPTPTPDELPPEAYRALEKAWSGYKMAREEQRDAVARADHFASIINGIRAVNGQDPLEFDDLEGFEGGRPLPDDGSEEFPTDEGQMSLDEAKEEGRLSGAVQTGLNRFVGDCYDPCEEFEK